jgi:SAM-dependent methyltransferase
MLRRRKAMTEQAREVPRSGTWGTRKAAAEWRRGSAARLQAFGPATELMLDLVNVVEGGSVLDVGAGAGDSTLVAAQRVGSSGHVLATDVSAHMLEVAAELARQAGLNNVETRVVDAQRLDLDQFRLGAPGLLEDAYGRAGLREIAVRTIPTRRRFPSLAQAMQYARGPLPLRELMARAKPRPTGASLGRSSVRSRNSSAPRATTRPASC